jgi:hypothetical protein
VTETPFESIDSAQRFIRLLIAQVEDVHRSLADDVARATGANSARQQDAIRLVDYKLGQLERHLSTSSRLLKDLRILRRLLLGDGETGGGGGVRS